MLGFKRRRTVEGWSLDVSSPEGEEKSRSWLQKLGDNNKLWACSLAVIVLASIFLASLVQKRNSVGDGPPPGHGALDQRYFDFAHNFKHSYASDAIIVNAHFVNTNIFRITTVADVGNDDIGFMSRIAAEEIQVRFKHRVVVQVYRKQPDGTQRLAATTIWDTAKGGYVTRHTGAGGPAS